MVDFTAFGPERSVNNQLINMAAGRAGVRTSEAQASALERANADAELLSRLAREGQAEAGVSPTDQMERLANRALQSGAVTAAAKLTTDVATIRQREATALAQQSSALKKQADLRAQQMGEMYGFASGIADEESYERSMEMLEATGGANPFKGMPYVQARPYLEAIKQGTPQGLSKLSSDVQGFNAMSADKARESANAFRKARLKLLEEQLRLQREREARMKKEGGKTTSVVFPTGRELQTARAILVKAFPGMAEQEEELMLAAPAIASRARDLRKANPALDATEALQKAFEEISANGDFQKIDSLWARIGITDPSVEFRAGAGGELPTLKSAGGEYVTGQVYQTPKGPMRFNGRGFIPVPAAVLGGDAADDADDAMEDELDTDLDEGDN